MITAADKKIVAKILASPASSIFVIDHDDDDKNRKLYTQQLKKCILHEKENRNSIYVIISPISSYQKTM